MDCFTKPVVLIVEDECLIRMLAADAFLAHGFAVLEAEDAAEALEVHRVSGPVDLLFTDVNMPGELNGIDLAERLSESQPALKVMITSALPLLRPVDHVGAVFTPKPYDTDTVCRAAGRLLAA